MEFNQVTETLTRIYAVKMELKDAMTKDKIKRKALQTEKSKAEGKISGLEDKTEEWDEISKECEKQNL